MVMAMLIRMDLARIIIMENGDQQVIVLREREGERTFPIMIGLYEALAIDRRIRGQISERPMTHDLAANIIREMDGDLEKIIISDLRDRTFFAKLLIRRNGELVEVDSRPSDAIALGAGTSTPIYVDDGILNEVC
jgi:bifunctional DNase/RNase